MKNPGIKEIATLAGVSIGTVDRALHNRGRVSPETKKRVEEIARQINYRPNLMARSLVIKKKTVVAMLIPDPRQDEYWKQAYRGMERIMTKFEQQGLFFEPFFYLLDNKDSFATSARKILDSTPQGVIMAPNFLQEGKWLYEKCMDLSIPVVMFDTVIPGTRPLAFIGTDSFQSGRVAAELLTMTAETKGKFAILHFDEELVNSPHMLEKERGFLSYLKEESPEREYLVNVLNNKQHYYRNQLKHMLEKNTISGIFVSTSKTYRIGSFLQKEGMHDIVLAGYDLTSRNTALLMNGTIRFLINQNPSRQAEESINVFYNHLIYREPVPSSLLFPIEIIVRSNLLSYLKIDADLSMSL
jgi:LacI family transcriptional regulator